MPYILRMCIIDYFIERDIYEKMLIIEYLLCFKWICKQIVGMICLITCLFFKNKSYTIKAF